VKIKKTEEYKIRYILKVG